MLLVAAGLTTQHANPRGSSRRVSLTWAAPFAEHFTVYLANRRPVLPTGTSMSDLAADYATAIEHDIGGPVLLHGTSTGGSIALQLAVDRPELVRRLVLAAAACRLSPRGRTVMAEVARLTEAGDVRAATAAMVAAGTPPRLRLLTRPAGWVMGQFTAADQSDMLITIAAEDELDAEPRPVPRHGAHPRARRDRRRLLHPRPLRTDRRRHPPGPCRRVGGEVARGRGRRKGPGGRRAGVPPGRLSAPAGWAGCSPASRSYDDCVRSTSSRRVRSRVESASGGIVPMPAVAPYVAATTAVRDRASLAWHLAGHRLAVSFVDGSVSLTLTLGGPRRRCAAAGSTAPTHRPSWG